MRKEISLILFSILLASTIISNTNINFVIKSNTDATLQNTTNVSGFASELQDTQLPVYVPVDQQIFADPSTIPDYRESGLIFDDISQYEEYRRSATVESILADDPIPPSISNLAGLPPIGDQGSQGSCVGWAWGYYCLSHQIAVANGYWDTSVSSHQFSPAYIYNQINDGTDSGSYFYDAAMLTESFGCATMTNMPYSDTDCISWPSEAAYTEAMSYRTLEPEWDSLYSDSDLAVLKAYLAAGNTALMGIFTRTAFYGFDSENNIYTTSHATGALGGGHAVCVVGYDDDKSTTDGPGAFLLVNSWGSDWGDGGFWWMSYEAVKDSRLSQCVFYYCDVIEQPYTPSLTGSIRVSHEKRGDVLDAGIMISLEVNGYEEYYTSLNFGVLMADDSGLYQNHPFPGNHIVFDLSDFSPYLSTRWENEFILLIGDSVWPLSGVLESFSVHSYLWDVEATSTETPYTIHDNQPQEEVSAFLAIPTIELEIDPYVSGTVEITGTALGDSADTIIDTGFEPGSFEQPWYTNDANSDNGDQLWGVDTYHTYTGGSSIWCGGSPSSTAVYTEHFIMPVWYWPTGWTRYSAGLNENKWYPIGTSTQYQIQASTGGMSDVKEWVIQGPLDRSSATELCLTFWMDYEVDNAQANNFASVLYSTNGSLFYYLERWWAPVGESFSFVGEQEILLPDDAICSTLYFAFIFQGDYTGSMTVDDIDIWDIGSEYENDADSYAYCYVDISDFGSATMSFDYWADVEDGYDWFSPGYYISGTWTTPYTLGTTTDWEHFSFSIPTSATRIGFFFHSDSSVVRQGVYVDNVQLISEMDPISSVEILIDGISQGYASGVGSWTYSWDTTTFTEEEHDVTARATIVGSLYTDTASTLVDNTAPRLVSAVVPYQTGDNITVALYVNSLGGSPIKDVNFWSGSIASYFCGGTVDIINATTYLVCCYLLDTIPEGHYEFQMYALDYVDNIIIVPMALTVDRTDPLVSTPSDIEYNEGSTGNSIVWTCTDLNPGNYELYRNDDLVLSGVWTNGLNYSIDGLSVGTYTFTITFWDLAGNSISDIVIVTITANASTSTTSNTTTSNTETSTNTQTTDTNTSSQPSEMSPLSIMVMFVSAGSLAVIIVVIILIKRKN